MKTKSILLLLFIMLIYTDSKSQWYINPENPAAVCDTNGLQYNPITFSDGEDGLYVFWLDSRNDAGYGTREVYGQHYNSNGIPQWEDNGRLIVQHFSKINSYGVNRFDDGTMIIGWSTKSPSSSYTDTLFMQKISPEGIKQWTDDLVMVVFGFEPNAILSVGPYQIIKDNLSYCVNMTVTYFGGSNGNRMNRFDESGNLFYPQDGTPEGPIGGVGRADLRSALNPENDVYLFYSGGNGAGAPLYCMKLSSTNDTVWGPVNVIAGTSGLNYKFDAISDSEGITFIWEGSGNNTDLFCNRYLSNGTMDWGGNVVAICNEEGQQSSFDIEKSGNYYYVTWADARPTVDPGNYDIYAQKIDTQGNVMWANNGVEVISDNTYIPIPKFTLTQENQMIIMHQSTIAGYVGQLLNDDGSVGWSSVGAQIGTTSFNPQYEQHDLVRAGNHVIAVWADAAPSGGADNIYISPVDTTDVFTGFTRSELKEKLVVYPNPANDLLTIKLFGPHQFYVINLYTISGLPVYSKKLNPEITDNEITLDAQHLNSGIYLMQLQSKDEQIYRRVIITH